MISMRPANSADAGSPISSVRAAAPARTVLALSAGILRIERVLIMAFMGLLVALILLNVVTRYAGASLYWVDESAVYSVVWLAFIGGSAMTRLRLDFAMTMLTDNLSPAWARRAKVTAGLGVMAFAAALGMMCWLWLDPAGLAQAGFDAKRFAASTFNFVYTERTQTLNWPAWVVYLIVPIFSGSLFVHGLANVLEDLGWAPATQLPGFDLGTNEGIN